MAGIAPGSRQWPWLSFLKKRRKWALDVFINGGGSGNFLVTDGVDQYTTDGGDAYVTG